MPTPTLFHNYIFPTGYGKCKMSATTLVAPISRIGFSVPFSRHGRQKENPITSFDFSFRINAAVPSLEVNPDCILHIFSSERLGGPSCGMVVVPKPLGGFRSFFLPKPFCSLFERLGSTIARNQSSCSLRSCSVSFFFKALYSSLPNRMGNSSKRGGRRSQPGFIKKCRLFAAVLSFKLLFFIISFRVSEEERERIGLGVSSSFFPARYTETN